MGFLSGTRLTALGAALIALAAAAGARVAVTDGFRAIASPAPAPGAAASSGTAASSRTGLAPGAAAALSAGDHLALALSAEKSGDVAAALSHYRAAVSADPRCVDRRSPGFLGDAFEGKLNSWIAGMKSGRIAAGPKALSDASFIFRRMYGGCG